MKNILYVEDSGGDRELMELAIGRTAKSLRLTTVASGELACDYLEGCGQFADRLRFPFPDLVLLDLKMGAMSGFDVLSWIRARREIAALQVVIYSSSFVDSDVETGYKLGADAFLTKPGSWLRQIEVVSLLQEYLHSEPPNLALLRALPEYQAASGEVDVSSNEENHGTASPN